MSDEATTPEPTAEPTTTPESSAEPTTTRPVDTVAPGEEGSLDRGTVAGERGDPGSESGRASPEPGGGNVGGEAPHETTLSSGKGLVAAGFLTIPLGVGAAFGYWGADRGVLWYPLLGGLLTLWIAGALAMIGGVYLRGPAIGRKRGRRRIVVLALLAICLAGAKAAVLVVDQETPLTSLGPNFQGTWSQDASHYRQLDHALAQSYEQLAALDAFAVNAGEANPLRADEEPVVLAAWSTFLHASFVLDRTRRFYEDYMYFDPSRIERDRHLRSYLLTFAAELALYERTAAIVDLLGRNANAVKFLDIERKELGLPKNSVAFVREELAGLTDLTRVLAGKRYLQIIDKAYGARRVAEANGYGWVWARVEQHLRGIEQRSTVELSTVTVANDLAPIKRKLKQLYFPVQKNVAEWMGDTKVRRAGEYLISGEQLRAFQKASQPGDIMISRKNWYLSNIGLPGFWPHALLYVGTDEQLAKAFDEDPEVRAWLKRKTGREQGFSEYLAKTYPEAWRSRGQAEEGHPFVVIEAISEGVVQNSLEHAAGDYLASMRPRMPSWVKARAIARAFGYLERPYDFDFDFATDHELVCSELVWRSYRPLKGKDDHGLRVPMVTVAGRRTLPANEYVRLFRDEHGRDSRQLEFARFLEGVEKDQMAVVSDEKTFLETVDRPKWDVLQR